jgi:hypothetical protein
LVALPPFVKKPSKLEPNAEPALVICVPTYEASYTNVMLGSRIRTYNDRVSWSSVVYFSCVEVFTRSIRVINSDATPRNVSYWVSFAIQFVR